MAGSNCAIRARWRALDTFGQGILIEPQPGMLLAFPAWLEHFVHPFFGEGERISVAINVMIRKVGEIEPR
jgi:Putative 2OG-Fe(II) oxygenase